MKCPVCHHQSFEEITPGEVRCTYCDAVLVLDRTWFRLKHILLASTWIITLLVMFFVKMKYALLFGFAAAMLIVFVDWKTDKYRIKRSEKEF